MTTLKSFLSALLLVGTCSCAGSEFDPLKNESEDTKTMCTKDAISTCRLLSPGIYIEESYGRTGPGCEFPEVDPGDLSLCRGTLDVEELANAAKDHDGKKVSVSGRYGSLQSDVILSCAEDGPFKGGEPTLSDTYSPDTSGYGIMGQEGILMKAELDPSDARASDPNYFSTISSDAEFTFHGTFKYKTVIPPCGNGSIIHPSGAIILELQEN